MASVNSYYSLTFVPGCNKNIDYVKILYSSDDEEKVKEFLSILINKDIKDIKDFDCDPFECFEEGCDGSCDSRKVLRCNGCFDRKKLLNQKYFFEGCCSSDDHFRIDVWSSKNKYNKTKKDFIDEIQYRYC